MNLQGRMNDLSITHVCIYNTWALMSFPPRRSLYLYIKIWSPLCTYILYNYDFPAKTFWYTPKDELTVSSSGVFVWHWVSNSGKGLLLFMIYVTQSPTCKKTQYLGPMKETSPRIKLRFHCKVQYYVRHFLDYFIRHINKLTFYIT